MHARSFLAGLLAGYFCSSANALSPLNDQDLAEATGMAGLSISLDAHFKGGDLAYINSENPSQQLYTVLHSLQGKLSYQDLRLDLGAHASLGPAMALTLPSEIRFENFGFKGLYLASNQTVTPPAPPARPASFSPWPQEKIYHLLLTTYGNCGDSFETCQGSGDSFRLSTTHGRLNPIAAGQNTGITASNLHGGNRVWDYQRTQPGVGRNSGDHRGWPYENRDLYGVYGNCPGIMSSAACRNHWIELRIPYKANVQIDYAGTNLTINDPYLIIVDTSTGQVIRRENNRPVLGVDNRNARANITLGNDIPWPTLPLPAPGSDRLLMSMTIDGNFRFGGQVIIAP